MVARETVSRSQARRVALAAQGFVDPAHAVATMRTFDRTLRRTGVLQVDSVNVLARAHLMPLYSRMGPYDTALLHRAADGARPGQRRLVEYFAHVQAYMPVELWPLMRHRMDSYRPHFGKWWGQQIDASLAQEVLRRVRSEGPSTARDLDAGLPRSKDHWGWNWSDTRKALDYLFSVGDVAVAGRNAQFEIRYDVPERVLPAEVLAAPVPEPQAAVTELVRRAAVQHGVASERCLADYYRLRAAPKAGEPDVRTAVRELVESGELLPVRVEGWNRQAYLHRDARLPRRVGARSLLSPFDPLVWERDRAEALFDFFYRIEIYTPAHKRVHGYYVLPFLLGERIVGRVDLKADRRTSTLLVRAAHREPGAPDTTADELAAELWRLAGWLGLDDVVVEPSGELAADLAAAVRVVG